MRQYNFLFSTGIWMKSMIMLLLIIVSVACSARSNQLGSTDHSDSDTSQSPDPTELADDELLVLPIPEIEAVNDRSGPIKVIATTSIIGDVVSQIGGEYVDLVTLMKAGQDPHSFVSSISDLRSVSESDVIFIAGWNLEEGLIDDLRSVSESPQVPVSASIRPRLFAADDESSVRNEFNARPDPHTWLNPRLVLQWVTNIGEVLSELDPGNSDAYQANTEAYMREVTQLIDLYDSTIDTIDPLKRKLVTNHDSLGYFADAYDFEIVGAIIPAGSTLAEPSARELAELVRQMDEAGLCTIFADTTTNNQLATAVVDELEKCAVVHTLDLYTGALGTVGSEADTYIKMMKKNIETLEYGLR